MRTRNFQAMWLCIHSFNSVDVVNCVTFKNSIIRCLQNLEISNCSTLCSDASIDASSVRLHYCSRQLTENTDMNKDGVLMITVPKK